MKGKILQILKADGDVVSGETVSRELGITRVSVWKHIRKLQELGYDIVSTPKGYRLAGSPDALFPWAFPGREERIHYVPETTSTMDMAREMARKGCPHLSVVVAGRQKAGRGRLRRVWLSPAGGLYFTMVLRPEIPTELTARVNFFASMILARVLRGSYGIDAKLKWPNDILVNGDKLCGMLSEMEAEAGMATFVNIGIGINVNNDPRPKEQGATSLKKLLGRRVFRADVLTDFLDAFESRFDLHALDNVVAEWKRYTMTIGQQVRIVTTRETTAGFAEDVDENGALLLKLANGTRKRVICGDCFQ